ncbi:hypothetical protein PVAP13_9NG020651 [Panicum virgatum]|jgi:hypothetical protein|uniref:Sialate O-acetylesterase domain-containing protein n=1 Tax=Panicum virgatum TaxID=38727 RepID=A0A8T0MCD2_PANVG|nr:hypothetical protein PVAP13_9NG020651 [Panicum virgatum]
MLLLLVAASSPSDLADVPPSNKVVFILAGQGIDAANHAVGVGPGMPFANALLRSGRAGASAVGLVPCAVGGTRMADCGGPGSPSRRGDGSGPCSGTRGRATPSGGPTPPSTAAGWECSSETSEPI